MFTIMIIAAIVVGLFCVINLFATILFGDKIGNKITGLFVALLLGSLLTAFFWFVWAATKQVWPIYVFGFPMVYLADKYGKVSFLVINFVRWVLFGK